MSTPVDAPHRLGSDEEIPESQDEEITSESSSDEDEELSSSDEESDSSTADGSGKTKFSLSSMLTRGDSDSDDEDSEQKRLNLVKNITKLSNGTYAAADMNTPAETRPESQFTSSSASGKVQLSAETLLGALGGGVSDKLLTESVQVNEAKSAASVPIAKTLTDRAKRQLGYQKSKETASQWIPLVKKHREAEHISFPLNQPEASNLTNASLSAKFTPNVNNSMESQVHALLQESGMDERDLRAKEDRELALNKITEEEVLERRKKMAKMRSILFYQEQKAKRIKKIKSKMYHKIRNKQQDKFNKLERERLRRLDPELAKKLDEQDAKKYAEERFTLRHRNMSKWAKNALKRGQLHKDGTKEAVEESLRIGQELRRKMNHVNNDDSSSSEESSSEDGDDESDDDNTDASSNDIAKKMTKKMINKMAKEKNVPKGIMALKFMQRATETQRQRAMEEAQDLLAELEGDKNGKNSHVGGSLRPKMVGRRQLGQGGSNAGKKSERAGIHKKNRERINSLEGSDDSDDDGGVDNDTTSNGKDNNGPTNASTRGSGKTRISQRLKNKVKDRMKNGALQIDEVAMSAGFSTRIVDSGKSSNVESSIIRWDNGTQDDSKEGAFNLEEEHISTTKSAPTSLANDDSLSKSKRHSSSEIVSSKDTTNNATKSAKAVSNPWLSKESKSPSNENSSASTKSPKKRKVGVIDTSIKEAKQLVNSDKSLDEQKAQYNMIQSAFAGDDVEKQFEAEKKSLVDGDSSQKKAPTLAGWGSWAGNGAPTEKSFSRRKNKKMQKKKRVAEAAAKAKRDARRDKDLKHVIISEKRNKHVAKYNVEAVPYPFKSRAEYEASLRNPLGPEWNTTDAHSALVRPQVVVEAGAVIDPIKMSESYKRKLPQILKKSFEEHKRKQRKLRHAKRKTKL